MIDIEENKKRKSFALEYGTILGFAWILVFATYIISLTSSNHLAMMGCYAGFIGIAFLPFMLVNRFKNKHTSPNQEISYWQAIHFCFLMFSYAILMTGIAEYIYFEYIDHGAVVSSLENYLNDPKMDILFNEHGMSDIKVLMKDNIEILSTVSSFDLTMSLAQMNIMTSMVLIFIVALFMKKQKTDYPN